jgi:hypothetical protein
MMVLDSKADPILSFLLIPLQSVMDILRRGFQDIGNEEQAMFLDTAAFLPDQPLWRDLLLDLYLAAADPDEEKDVEDAEEVMDHLERRSLITIGGHPSYPPQVMVHDLFRQLARSQIEAKAPTVSYKSKIASFITISSCVQQFSSLKRESLQRA